MLTQTQKCIWNVQLLFFFLNAIICFLSHQSIYLIILYNVIRTRAFCSKYAEWGTTFHFLRWDRYTLQIASFKKYEESIRTGRNEDSLLCVSTPRNAYIFFGSSDFRYFCVQTTTLSHDRNILIFRIRVTGK